jgi:hypothetical protein
LYAVAGENRGEIEAKSPLRVGSATWTFTRESCFRIGKLWVGFVFSFLFSDWFIQLGVGLLRRANQPSLLMFKSPHPVVCEFVRKVYIFQTFG